MTMFSTHGGDGNIDYDNDDLVLDLLDVNTII